MDRSFFRLVERFIWHTRRRRGFTLSRPLAVEPLAPLVPRVPLARVSALLVRLALVVELDQPDPQVRRDQAVQQEELETLGLLVLVAERDLPDPTERQVRPALQAQRDPRVESDLLGLALEPQAQPDR